MTKTEHEVKTVVELIGNILLGGVLALAVCCALLFLASVAISAGWLKEDLISEFAVAGCAVGTACGALCAILRCKSKTLVIGLAVAAVFFLLLLTAGLMAYGQLSLEQGGILRLCASLCGGGAMGLLCGRPRKKKRRA